MIARVVPDVPSFSVDEGFRYSVPPDLSLEVGAVVRVPLGGRKVRGFVVDVDESIDDGLKPVRARSGDLPVFDAKLLQTLRWASQHYVAPLSTLFRRAAPPNLPRSAASLQPGRMAPSQSLVETSPAAAIGREIAAGRTRNLYLQSPSIDDLTVIAGPVLGAGRSVLLVAPTGAEATAIGARLQALFGDRALTVLPETPDAETTAAWVRCNTTTGLVLVGTPRIALWHLKGLGAAIVTGEARRAMKDRQTPTLHAREVLRIRSSVERFALITTGIVPSTEIVAAGTEIRALHGGRPWSLIELVDRRTDPPGSGVFADHTKAAIAGLVGRGEPVFVFTHRRGYAPVFRCGRCRALRLCDTCGARVERDGVCRRCSAEQQACASCGSDRFEPLGAGVDRVLEATRRFVDPQLVGTAGERRQVTVGSVRDLPEAGPAALAVVVDGDGLVLGTDFRAAEEALRSLARVASLVGSGRGRRTIVQTSNPEHPVLDALRRGDAVSFLRKELEVRAEFGFPPVGDLIVVECRPAPSVAPGSLQGRLPDATVLGPAAIEGGTRWLLQGSDLSSTRSALRKLAGEWRDAGSTVRIDVDPIDL